MGSPVRPYTDLPGFEAVVLEESYVLAIQASPGEVTFEVELALTAEHRSYVPPRPDETECFRRGQIRFIGVRQLVWRDQGAPPAVDSSGDIDFGHIDSLEWDNHTFVLAGDWGRMELSAAWAELGIRT